MVRDLALGEERKVARIAVRKNTGNSHRNSKCTQRVFLLKYRNAADE